MSDCSRMCHKYAYLATILNERQITSSHGQNTDRKEEKILQEM